MNKPEVKIRMVRCQKCWNDKIDVEREVGQKPLFYVICSNEKCSLSTMNFDTKKQAIENWNHWNNPKTIKKKRNNPR